MMPDLTLAAGETGVLADLVASGVAYVDADGVVCANDLAGDETRF